MSPIRHLQQTDPDGRSSCVPACVAMVLQSEGIDVNEAELCRVLSTEFDGTELSQLAHLPARLGAPITVTLESGSLSRLQNHLAASRRTIAFLAPPEFPGNDWHHQRLHAVVVIGVNDDTVAIHDPLRETGPTRVSLLSFMSLWAETEFFVANFQVG